MHSSLKSLLFTHVVLYHHRNTSPREAVLSPAEALFVPSGWIFSYCTTSAPSSGHLQQEKEEQAASIGIGQEQQNHKKPGHEVQPENAEKDQQLKAKPMTAVVTHSFVDVTNLNLVRYVELLPLCVSQ